MTEYNYFCWSEKYNDDKSFQQPRYRIFNVQVPKEEYEKVKKIYHKLEFDPNDSYEVRFSNVFKKMWDKLTEAERQEYLDIPHFNAEGFKFITGIDVADYKVDSLVGKEVTVDVDGKKYKAIIQ